MKIQIKIALLFTILCTLIIVVLSTAVYYFAHEKAFEDFYVRLELRATIAAKVKLHEVSENTAAYEEVRYQYLQRLPQEKEYIMPIDSLSFFAKATWPKLNCRSLFTAIYLQKVMHLTAKDTSFLKAFITVPKMATTPLFYRLYILTHLIFLPT